MTQASDDTSGSPRHVGHNMYLLASQVQIVSVLSDYCRISCSVVITPVHIVGTTQ